MDASLREQTPEALKRILQDAQERLHALRFSAASSQLRQVHEIRKTRREIARINTILGQQKNADR